MTLNQLRVFVTLSGAGSVHETARRHFVSQPAVSATVSALQKELGVRLVERDGRGIRLTAAGVVLAGYGRRIIGLWEEARSATVAGADPERGRLRLAAVTTAGEQIVPAVLASFRGDHREVEVILEVGNRSHVWDLLANGEVELAIGGRPPQGGDLVSLAEADNDLIVVRAIGIRATNSPRQVTINELAQQTWLVREPGSGTRAAAEELFEELGIAPSQLTLGSNGALRESAMVGLGAALISRAAVGRQLAEGSLEELRAGPLPLQRPWNLVARSGWDLPATTALFVEHLVMSGQFRPTSSLSAAGGRTARCETTSPSQGPAHRSVVPSAGAPIAKGAGVRTA